MPHKLNASKAVDLAVKFVSDDVSFTVSPPPPKSISYFSHFELVCTAHWILKNA